MFEVTLNWFPLSQFDRSFLHTIEPGPDRGRNEPPKGVRLLKQRTKAAKELRREPQKKTAA